MNDKYADKTYDEIFLKYYNIIVKYCDFKLNNIEIAKDISSDVFLLLLSVWESYGGHPESGIKVWLYKTADNMVKNHFRKTETKTLPINEFIHDKDFNEYCADKEEVQYKEYLKQIRNRLSDDEKMLFDYIVINNYGYEKTAKLMNLTVNAVKIRWIKIRNRYRDYINNLIEM